MVGAEIPVLVVQSSFRNESAGHWGLTSAGAGLFCFFLAIAVAVAIGRLEWISKAILVAVLVTTGLAVLALVVPAYVLVRTATLYHGGLEYTDLWQSLRIPDANALAAFNVRKGAVTTLFAFSRTGTTIVIGHGFREEDKARMWNALKGRLTFAGIHVEENVTEAQAQDTAAALDKALPLRPTREPGELHVHRLTRVLRSVALGGVLTLFLGFGAWGLQKAVAETQWTGAALLICILVAVGLLTASFPLRSSRLFLAAMFIMGADTAAFGITVVAADLGDFAAWIGGAVLLCFGVFVCFSARGLAQTLREKRS